MTYAYSFKPKPKPYISSNYNMITSGILVFVTTIVFPMDLGLTKLSMPIAIVIFTSGFVSLFLLSRNIDKAKGIDSTKNSKSNPEIKIPRGISTEKRTKEHPKTPMKEDELIPLELVKRQIGNMLISYGDILDKDTKDKFSRLCQQLDSIHD